MAKPDFDFPVVSCSCESHKPGYHDLNDSSVGYTSDAESLFAGCVEYCFCCGDRLLVHEDGRMLELEELPC